ncbi:protease-like protein [Candidatus Koribacter versatilis Ellin345]|uniref:Protease-like protein n=1 Tax=Koribacter versatilis (strain Ellin345) TaxID=204669 RepID=Q1IVJ0_KORVE|nr:Ig-like domain repeat protein [Candidatus Koribacter versatilis]ABF39110.1 protease-like protein [Candidatus Koribacter versatilis Ellin345]
MNRFFVRARLLSICLALLWIASYAGAQAVKNPSRITQKIDNTARVTLSGTVPKAAKNAHDLGEVDGGMKLQRMMLVLKPSAEQQASLQRLLDSQQNKKSPNHHKWLTPEKFAASYGPSEEDVAKVKNWLESQGMSVSKIGNGRQWIEFSGSAHQVGTAFGTSLHYFETNGERHMANATEISIPRAISPVVSGVLSLHNFHKQPNTSKLSKVKLGDDGKLAPVDPAWTYRDYNLNPYYYLAPTDAQKIYNASPLLNDGVDGTGISIAVAGRSNIYLSDVQLFRNVFGLKQNDPNFIVNGPDPGYPFGDLVENTLDVEWASAMAPGATINFVASGSTDTTDGVDLSAAYIVDNAVAPIVTVSYGLCEALMGPASNQFYNSLWAQAAAQGMTVFVSTGDVGAAECDGDLQRAGYDPPGPAQYGPTISGLSSTPYNVAVGGTQYNEGSNFGQYWSPNNDSTFGSVLGYVPEQAWNESCDPNLPQEGTNCVYGQTNYNLDGGGGGPSNCSQSTVDDQGLITCVAGTPKPSWQTGLGVPNDGVRDTPDLSLNASPDDDGFLFCLIGGCQTTTVNGQTILTNASTIGGTSASTPAMAGIMALIEQKNGAFQGQANYIFYKLAAMDDQAACDSSKRTDPTATSTCNFNDVTMGSNSVPGLPGYGTDSAEWSATTGYDMATGLGTVNAANIATNWAKVTFAASSTALTVGGGTVAHGDPVTVNIAVTATDGGSSKPTGPVSLVTDKYGAVGQVTLDANGSYSGPVANLPGGSYSLTAQYGGDGTFGASTSAPAAVTVTPEDSTTTIIGLYTVDPNTSRVIPYTGSAQWAYPLWISVKVDGKSGEGRATGTVNVLRNGTVVMSAPLNSDGSAYIQTGNGMSYTFPAGDSDLSIQYSGDSGFNASTSGVTKISFTPQKVWSTIQISWWQVQAGQPVLLTAGVRAFGTPVPTGTMTFYDNGKKLSDAIPLATDGPYGPTVPEVTYTAKLTTVGDHWITAEYSGDANYAAVAQDDPTYSWGSSYTVIPAAGETTTTTVTQYPAAVSFGQWINFLVNVKPAKAGGAAPTGEVVLTSNGQVNGQGNLVNGQVTISVQAGAQTAEVYAQYQGDSTYASSSSGVFKTTIAKLDSTVSLTTTGAYVLAGQQTSLNFVVQGYYYNSTSWYQPQGSVQFFDAVNGGAPQAITAQLGMTGMNPWANSGLSLRETLPAGTNVITAQYSGDSYFNPATTAAVTVVVSPPDFTVSSDPSALTISAGGTTSAILSVAPILGFSGAVTLTCGDGLPAGTTCSFSPATLDASGGQSTMTVTMKGPFTNAAANHVSGWWMLTGGSGALGFFLLGISGKRRKYLAGMLATIALFGLMMACGGDSHPPAATTSVMLESSQPKVAAGASVTFTADVSGGNNGATGSVTFYDGTTALGNAVDVSNGQATLAVNTLTVGTHAITAKYTGDSSHAASVSQPMYQAITGTTTLAVTATSGSTSHVLNLNLTVQ